MKAKILNACLILTSLFGYLEWGTGNHQFLFQTEAVVLSKLFSDPVSVMHPFILLPLFGQLLLLITLFQKTPNKILTWIGLGCLSLLILFMLVVGALSANYKIILSVLPFMVIAVWTGWQFKNKQYES